MLPPPPTTTTTVTAPAPVAAPVAAAQAPAAPTEKTIAKFGAAKNAAGEQNPVPSLNGLDLLAIRKALTDAVTATVGDTETVSALLESFASTPKSAFPGSKQGKAAFALGNVLRNLHDVPKAARTGAKKTRVKLADKYKNVLGKLANAFGGAANLRAALTDEDLKGLDLGL